MSTQHPEAARWERNLKGVRTWTEGVGPSWAVNFDRGDGREGDCRHPWGLPPVVGKLCRWPEDQGKQGEREGLIFYG